MWRLDNLSKQLKGSLSKLDHLALSVFFTFVIGLDLFVCNGLNHLHYLFRLPNQVYELLVLRFQELKERPDGNVLEGGISACEKAV